MHIPTTESAKKLKAILQKRFGHELIDYEILEAYDNLIGFAYALIDLQFSSTSNEIPAQLRSKVSKQYVAS